MGKTKCHYIFLILVFVCVSSADGQDTLNTYFTPQFQQHSYYQITSIYGTQYRGEVVQETKSDLEIIDRRTNTKHKINKNEIKEIKPIGANRKNSPARFDDNYYTNYYMLAENALPFKKESVNATTHYFIENCNYAFNEHWAISFNVLLFLPSSVGVKCSYELSQDLHFGANAYVWALPQSNSNLGGYYSPIMGANARVTKGDQQTNFTLGAGVMAIKDLDNSNLSVQKKNPYTPVYYLNFAYANRFSKHAALNIENFLFPQAFSNQRGGSVNLNLTGLSIKWIRDSNTHWNFGCYGLYLGDITKLNTNSKVLPIPYLSFSQFLN